MRVEPLESRLFLAAPQVLFIRGATRSGGFLEATSPAARDAQLADISNTSTATGNTGWGTLAATLRGAGYSVTQINETKEANAPTTGFIAGRGVPFEQMDLTKYAAIVFGSNNARYSKAAIDAVNKYINNGGSALFISDANFGSNWRDAVDSDQQFHARFGIIVDQDNAAATRVLTRGGGDFVASTNAALNNVSAFTGEGMSALTLAASKPAGVSITRVVRMVGKVRNNDGTDPAKQYQGTLRTATTRDAALVLATSGKGRVAGFFDRNTFFNRNGLGTDITKYSNRQLALNLFAYLTRRTIAAAAAMQPTLLQALKIAPISDDIFSDQPILA